MSESIQTHEVEPEDVGATGAAASGTGKRQFDKGFARNMKIIGAVALVAVVGVAFVVFKTRASMDAQSEATLGQVSVPVQTGMGGGAANTEATQADLDRLNRVTGAEAEKAKASGQTFIPQNLPLNAQEKPLPDGGPAPTYDYTNGGQQAAGAVDTNRQGEIDKGLETQLASMASYFTSPESGRADPYQVESKEAATGSARGTQSASVTTATAAAPVLVDADQIAAAGLISPIDTARTAFVSARIYSGTLAGATVYGTAAVVNDEGVRVTFNRMSFKGKSYPVEAIALDTQASNDALNASVDKHEFRRYVLPILGAGAAAYAGAIANPGQEVVTTSGETVVATPAATAKQAVYAGIGAGITKGVEQAQSNVRTTAYMAPQSQIGILFLAPVEAK